MTNLFKAGSLGSDTYVSKSDGSVVPIKNLSENYFMEELGIFGSI